MKLSTKQVLEEMRELFDKKAQNASLEEKALAVLDAMLTEHDCGDRDKFTSTLYRIVHGCISFNLCYNVHHAWRDEVLREFGILIQELHSSSTETGTGDQ